MPMPSMPPLPAMPHLRPRFIPTLTEVVDPASLPYLPAPAANPEELVQAVLKQLAPALEAMVRQTVFEQLAAHKNQVKSR